MNSQVIWDDDPGQNVDHIAEHGFTPDEVDAVLLDPGTPRSFSRSTGLPCKFGWTPTGKHIVVIWDEDTESDPPIVYPVTAYEVPEPSER